MENQDSNSQPQPEAAPVVAGPSATELQAQLDEIKKQSEGRLRDLQQERAKRQEYEARLASAASPAENPGVKEDELGQVLKPYIAPIAQELEAMRLEKAQNYLVEKTGKQWHEIEADHELQDKLGQVIRKYGVTGNVYDKTTRAYELMQLEALKSKEEERSRVASAAQAQSLPSGMGKPTVSKGKSYTADEFANMSPREFGQMSKSGDFRKLPDGSFEFTPR